MRFLDRWRAVTAIRYHNGRAHCVKGKIKQAHLNEIAALFERACIPDAELYLTGDGRLDFSPEVPKDLHQPLRNILLGA